MHGSVHLDEFHNGREASSATSRRENVTVLRFIGDGESSFRLENGGGERVGWIRGRTIGFRGLTSEAEVLAAAVMGGGALAASLEQQTGRTELPRPPGGRLRIVHDGAYEWIADGKSPVARVKRPTADGDDSFGIEFVLPSVSDAVAIHTAQRIYSALVRCRGESDGASPARRADAGTRDAHGELARPPIEKRGTKCA